MRTLSKSFLDAVIETANGGDWLDIVDIPSKQDSFKFFQRLMMSETPSIGIRVLLDSEVLDYFFPYLQSCLFCKQNPKYHKDAVAQHCIKACDAAEKIFEIRAAALLHDIGKASVKAVVGTFKCLDCCKELTQVISRTLDYTLKCPACGGRLELTHEGSSTFYKHEVASAKFATITLQNLGVPIAQGKFIVRLIRNHMYRYTHPIDVNDRVDKNGWTDAAVRRFIKTNRITHKHITNLERFPLFLLREADRKSRGLEGRSRLQKLFEKRIKEVFKTIEN
jgi:tRNA nucleotidyltransferase/poly(A) polymerase